MNGLATSRMMTTDADVTSDAQLKGVFEPDFVALTGVGNSDKKYSVVFANGVVKYLRANGANQAQRFANEYAERILHNKVLFVTLHHGG